MQYFAYSIVYSFIVMFTAFSIGALVDGSVARPMSSILVIIAFILVYVVAMKRRLNDLGRTGWLSLIGFIPFLGGLFGLYLLFAPGDPNENKYGLPPAKSNSKGPAIVAGIFSLYLYWVLWPRLLFLPIKIMSSVLRLLRLVNKKSLWKIAIHIKRLKLK